MKPHHLELKLSGGIRASADVQLTPAQIRAIQIDPATAARYTAATALNALTACMKANPKWPQANKQAFATEAAAATMACVFAM